MAPDDLDYQCYYVTIWDTWLQICDWMVLLHSIDKLFLIIVLMSGVRGFDGNIWIGWWYSFFSWLS